MFYNLEHFCPEVAEFYEILLDDKLDNTNFQFINEDMVQMTYNFKDQFVDNSKNTNVYIACFTTSHARLETVHYLSGSPGREKYDRVLNFFHLSLTCFEFFYPRMTDVEFFLNSTSQIFRIILYLKKN